MGEAIQALGTLNSCAFGAATTGEQIARHVLEKDVVLARTASSHLHVGTFQFLAACGEIDSIANWPTMRSPGFADTWPGNPFSKALKKPSHSSSTRAK